MQHVSAIVQVETLKLKPDFAGAAENLRIVGAVEARFQWRP
jgi:hypothetical protein